MAVPVSAHPIALSFTAISGERGYWLSPILAEYTSMIGSAQG